MINNFFTFRSRQLAEIFFYLFVVFVIFQIKFLAYSPDLYNSGFFNPYLSHFLYLSDFFLILSFAFYCIGGLDFRFKERFSIIYVAFFIILLVMSMIVSVNKPNSAIHILRILEFSAMSLMMCTNLISLKRMLLIFLSTVFISALIGIFQFCIQHSVGLQFIGEPYFTSLTQGLARIEIFDMQLIRAYGTYSHPNIFAAYLVFSIILVLFYRVRLGFSGSWMFYGFLLILCLALFFAFSKSSYISLFIALTANYLRGKMRIFGLLLVFPLIIAWNSNTFVERLNLLNISKNIFLAHPFGIGMGNFTQVMQSYSDFELLPWNFQPVHNIYLLILNEIGLFGFLFFVGSVLYLYRKFVKMNEGVLFILLVAISVIGLFDHFFISLYQGQFLLWFFIGLACRYQDSIKFL